jgi:CheY-like chemotaxis protein
MVSIQISQRPSIPAEFNRALRLGPMTASGGIQAAGRPLRVRSSIRPSRASRLCFESEVSAIVERAAELKPDVIQMDVTMAKLNGLEASP